MKAPFFAPLSLSLSVEGPFHRDAKLSRPALQPHALQGPDRGRLDSVRVYGEDIPQLGAKYRFRYNTVFFSPEEHFSSSLDEG